MSETKDDELARTATAGGTDSVPTRESGPVGPELGRYRIERELGQGGMGVVHAAFDPDLERRVALKVLRSADAVDARQRLLREARAMARVTHANVISVFEVGSVSGRDYIAMDLIDGGTLEEWLASPQSEREILDAYISAGRGLAAAHAAGLVHRDFKPHNVLRRKDGRVVVTDFGLVVGTETVTEVPVAKSNSRPSFSGLTATGSMLGTPAYMAPEQWTNHPVGPHTDQFAFCVALWEALARERPFRTESIDELKELVCAGKHEDESVLPRRFRKIIARGLEPDPKDRWPSMDALLAALVRADRKPVVAIALGGAALVAAGVLVVVSSQHAAGDRRPVAAVTVVTGGCTEPAPVVFTAHDAEQLRQKGQGIAAKAFERDVAAWTKAREAACQAAPAVRGPQLACLDGVLARIDLVKRAVVASKATSAIDAGRRLIDPSVCATARPPRLSATVSPELAALMTLAFDRTYSEQPFLEHDADAFVEKLASDPCTAANAHLIAAGYKEARSQELDAADRAAQSCGDDRVIADVALSTIASDVKSGLFNNNSQLSAKVDRAEAFVARVSQPSLLGMLELDRALVARLSERPEEAAKRYEHAVKLFEESQLPEEWINSSLDLVEMREGVGTPEEVQKIPGILEDLRKRAVAELDEKDDLVRTIDRYRAHWVWSTGDIVTANAMAKAIAKNRPPSKPIKIVGRVVDAQGAPVAGAEVVTGPNLYGDTEYAARFADNQLRTTTGQDGGFSFDAAYRSGAVIAQLGDQRSAPMAAAETVTLTLAPTTRITGHVDLRGPSSNMVVVSAALQDPRQVEYTLAAPVHPDGSFELAGVPRGKVRVRAFYSTLRGEVVSSVDLDVVKPTIPNVQLELVDRPRSVFMLVRSTVDAPVPNAQIFTMPGRWPASRSAQDSDAAMKNATIQLALELDADAPAEVKAKSKPGDLYGIVKTPAGVASACAVGLPANLLDPALATEADKPKNAAKIIVKCVPLAPTDTIVVVEVPPWPRLD